MIGIDISKVRGIIGGLVLLFSYLLSFWRILKGNPGNRVIECGSITLIVFVLLVALGKIQTTPAWVLGGLGFLVFLLCLVTMFFLVRKGFRALLRRKTD